jgi:group I intron endonuclease
MYYYSDKRNPIAHKYLTHGSTVEPTHFFKDIKYNNIIKRQFYSSCSLLKDEDSFLSPSLNSTKNSSPAEPSSEGCSCSSVGGAGEEKKLLSAAATITRGRAAAATQQEEQNESEDALECYCYAENKLNINPVVSYNNILDLKPIILKDNKNKSGIYKITNKLNGNFYIGSSVNLSRRFTNYFSLSYISKVKSHLTISRALIKYGYSNFELEILEYCEVSNLLKREQFYIDSFKPIYNIAKIAGSTLGVKKSKIQRDNISKALKGKYTGEKSALFGRSLNLETKNLMSLARSGSKNPLYGKTHNDETKELMRIKKLGTFHSDSTKEKMVIAKGQVIFLYKFDTNVTTQESKENNKFILVKKFNSIRELGRYFSVSHSTISRYIRSGKLFKNCYKISNTLLNE